jgi:hypothetical protein
VKRFWLYLTLACLGWVISCALETSRSSDRLLLRIEEDRYFLEHAAVAFDADLAASLLSDSHEDERERTTSSFHLRLYSTEDGKALTEPLHLYTRKSPKHRHPAVPDGPFLTPDGSYAMVACYFPQQEIRIYDVRARRFQETNIPVPSVGSRGWSASPDGLVGYQTDAGFVIFDPRTASVVKQYQSPQDGLRVRGLTFDPPGRHLAVATSDGVWLVDPRGSEAPRTVFRGEASQPVFLKNGKGLAFLHKGQVWQLDVSSGKLVGKPFGNGYLALKASADGRLALASKYDLADVLELPSGKLRCQRRRIANGSYGEGELLSAAGDKVLAGENTSHHSHLVWDTRNGQQSFVLSTGNYRPPVALSPDGRLGVSCASDNISLWRL